MKYVLQCRSTASGLSWTYDVDFPSDKMAIEYAEKITAQMASTPWFMGLDLFSATQHVAFFSACIKPTVTTKLSKGAA